MMPSHGLLNGFLKFKNIQKYSKRFLAHFQGQFPHAQIARVEDEIEKLTGFHFFVFSLPNSQVKLSQIKWKNQFVA
jgi:hypothetical protein